jgi:large subunit ribosomal protein L21
MSKGYAIIETGGKQYRVKKGDVIEVELLNDVKGDKVVFDQVLFVDDGKSSLVGAPCVKGYVVKGTLLGEAKGPKTDGVKYKRRKQFYRHFGHRQKYSQVKVSEIAGKGA